MTNLASISLSGLKAAQTQLAVAAHNVANLNTPEFKRQQVALSADANGGVQTSITTASRAGSALEADVVAQLQARHAFKANVAVFKSHDAMMASLLDLKA